MVLYVYIRLVTTDVLAFWVAFDRVHAGTVPALDDSDMGNDVAGLLGDEDQISNGRSVACGTSTQVGILPGSLEVPATAGEEVLFVGVSGRLTYCRGADVGVVRHLGNELAAPGS